MPKGKTDEPEEQQPPETPEELEDPTPPDGTPGRPGATPADLDQEFQIPEGDAATALAEKPDLDKGLEAPLTGEQRIEEIRRRRRERQGDGKRATDGRRLITRFQQEFPGWQPGMTRDEYLASQGYVRQGAPTPSGPSSPGAQAPAYPDDPFSLLASPDEGRQFLDSEFGRFLQSEGAQSVLSQTVQAQVLQGIQAYESYRETQDLTREYLPEDIRGHPALRELLPLAMQEAAQTYDARDEEDLAGETAEILVEMMAESGLLPDGGAKEPPGVPAGRKAAARRTPPGPRTEAELKERRRKKREEIKEAFTSGRSG